MQKIQICENAYQEIKKGVLQFEECEVNEEILSITGEFFYETEKYEIRKIGDEAFYNWKQLNLIKITSCVESIGNDCFSVTLKSKIIQDFKQLDILHFIFANN